MNAEGLRREEKLLFYYLPLTTIHCANFACTQPVLVQILILKQ